MNTPTARPTHDPIDDQLRMLIRTAVAATPMSPSVAEVEHGPDVRVTRSIEPIRRPRWVAVAAAVALVVVGLVWAVRTNEPAPVADEPASEPTGLLLGTYLLPTTVPAEWTLVDITEGVTSAGSAESHTWLITEPSAPTRAVLVVSGPRAGNAPVGTQVLDTTATDLTPTTKTVADTTTTVVIRAPDDWHAFGDGESVLQWIVGDDTVSLFINSTDESKARTIKAALRPNLAGDALTYSLTDGSGFDQRDLGRVSLTEAPYATLTYVNAAGVPLLLSLSPASATDITVLLHPDLPNQAARTDIDDLDQVSGSIITHGINAGFSSPNYNHGPEATLSEAAELLNSLAVVAASEWDAQVVSITNLIRSQPVVGDADVVGGTLTIHHSARIDGFCFTTATKQTGCRYMVPGVVNDPTETIELPILIHDRWIELRSLAADQTPGRITTDMAGVTSGIADTAAGRFIVLDAPADIAVVRLTVAAADGTQIINETYRRPTR